MTVRTALKVSLKGPKFKKSYVVHLVNLGQEYKNVFLYFARASLAPIKNPYSTNFNGNKQHSIFFSLRKMKKAQMTAVPRIMSWAWGLVADNDLKLSV